MSKESKAVYTIRENTNGGKDFWKQIGVAFTNKDGSLSVLLDALPLDGKLHIRDRERTESKRKGD